jgi:hypothetical protein
MLIERSNNAEKLWAALLPHVSAPEQRQFVVWANRFSDPQIERALMRTHRKFAPSAPRQDASTIHKYVTGLLLNLEREQTAAIARG